MKRTASAAFYVGGLILILIIGFQIVRAWNDAEPCVDTGSPYDCVEDRVPPERGR